MHAMRLHIANLKSWSASDRHTGGRAVLIKEHHGVDDDSYMQSRELTTHPASKIDLGPRACGTTAGARQVAPEAWKAIAAKTRHPCRQYVQA